MSAQIEARTLRDWLDAHEPLTVVDIRTDDDYAQWAIPGSLHVNAYEALRNGEAGALADLTLPMDRPVVTICNAGKVSQIAAVIDVNYFCRLATIILAGPRCGRGCDSPAAS